MKWIWIRHGETDQNAQRCYVGHEDVPLNEKGRGEAEHMAQRLRNEYISRIFSSDLQRCMETAAMIGEPHQLLPSGTPLLRELNFGVWGGKTYGQVMLEQPEQLTAWYENPFGICPPGGETLQQMGWRVDEWVQQQLMQVDKQGTETLLIVSHGGPIRWFQSRWYREDPSQFWKVDGIDPGQGLVVEWDDRLRVKHIHLLPALIEEGDKDR